MCALLTSWCRLQHLLTYAYISYLLHDAAEPDQSQWATPSARLTEDAEVLSSDTMIDEDGVGYSLMLTPQQSDKATDDIDEDDEEEVEQLIIDDSQKFKKLRRKFLRS